MANNMKKHPRIEQENNIFRGAIGSIRTLPAATPVAPSFLEFNGSAGNLTANGVDSSFNDPEETGIFQGVTAGLVMASAGWINTQNNGLVEVVEWVNNNKIIVRSLEGKTITTETGAGVRTFDATNERLRYRSFMFEDDVTVTFNSGFMTGQSWAIPAHEPWRLTDSMKYFTVDIQTRIMWGN